MEPLRGLCLGAGYFSQFHLDAWSRIEGARILAICDPDATRAREAAARHGIDHVFTRVDEALDQIECDFVDIVTPPATHRALVEQAAARGRAIICQKPLAPDLAEARSLVAAAEAAGVPFMVHENFRFQPWHREIKRLLEARTIGSRLHALQFRTRTGDGHGPDAYLARQPYFRAMPRFLVQETGVHFIDVFRFLAGEIDEVSATLRRLNPEIAGEDSAWVTFRFASQAVGLWDANRYNEANATDPRYTFGEFLVEASEGRIRLDGDGRIWVKRLGETELEHPYTHHRRGFAGDCVHAAQGHFIDRLRQGLPFETSGGDYLRTLAVQEAVYRSAAENRVVRVAEIEASAPAPPPRAPAGRRLVDLSLPIDHQMPGVSITVARRLEVEGWNATTLSLYSHCGTHMDAPRHFVAGGGSIDQIDLERCCGTALLIDLTPVEPKALIEPSHLEPHLSRITPGCRLLLRTDWYRRYGTPAYRDQLPRISVALAHWLVARQVGLIGVEPPSVADVNNMAELTEVHQILLNAGLIIVEGLANLDTLPAGEVQLAVLPLPIRGGDGCPARAVAWVE